MAQVFSRRFTLVLRLIALSLIIAFVLAIVTYRVNARSDSPENAAVEQPVPFSHKHHVSDDGIDCRYCHVSVETSSFAGIPPLSTCMTCHSQLFTNVPMLAPVRESLASGKPLVWARVNQLPDYVYFDHSIHIAKGVGCAECHGAVYDMPLMRQAEPLSMGWCLSCHRDPGPHLRPREAITDTTFLARNSPQEAAALMKAYDIHPAHLTDCAVCHR